MSLKTPRWSKEGELIRKQLELEGLEETEWAFSCGKCRIKGGELILPSESELLITLDAYHLALDKLYLAKEEIKSLKSELTTMRIITVISVVVAVFSFLVSR